MKPLEIEFKYPALKMTEKEFLAICTPKHPKAVIYVSGYDHFYADENKPNDFFRHRNDGAGNNELTYKRKTTTENNYIRVEHNIDLNRDVTREAISSLVEDLGFHYEFSIFKNSIVVIFDQYIVAYYTCYNVDMEELGSFFEIEVNEKYPWKDEQAAWLALVTIEAGFKSLGADPKNRISNSLFEMYRKNL